MVKKSKVDKAVVPEYDECAACVKCGSKKVGSEYKPAITMFEGEVIEDEFMLRTCERCRYRWRERPLAAGAVELAMPRKFMDLGTGVVTMVDGEEKLTSEFGQQ